MTKGTGSDANPSDADRVTFEVEVHRGTVTVTRAEATGCDSIGLVVRTLETLAHQKSEDEVWLIDVATIKRWMGAVSEENERCALTAIGALRAAIIDAHVTARARGEVKT